MKTILIFFISLLTLSSIAQSNGSLLIKCFDFKTAQPFSGIEAEVWQDSTCFSKFSNQQGKIYFNHLPKGFVQVKYYLSGQFINQEQFYIQEQQLFQTAIFFDTIYNQRSFSNSSNAFQYDLNSQNIGRPSKIQGDKYAASSSVYSSINSLSCVNIVAYKSPLIQKDAGSSCHRISREDITKLPVRSSSSIASVVGGVQQNETTGSLNVRGARDDANYYFIDGVKVRGSAQLPKSAINNISVYTSGIPANYGDVTGGVVDISTRSAADRSFYPKRKREYDRNKVEPKELTEEEVAYNDFYNSMNYERFTPIYENNFLSPLLHPHSTFGLDVDQAAWGFIKNTIALGRHVQRDAVKMEEMINAFKHQVVKVPENEMMHVVIERNNCSWNPNNELVTIHLKAQDFPVNQQRKPHNFVFLIDVSGSMSSENRLPLLIKGMKHFVETLQPQDRVSIVTYAGQSGVVLKSTTCENKSKILKALNSLNASGSTHGFSGIKEAYKQAELNFDPKFNNRIILATDGDFNVGINSPGDLKKYIETKRGKGIYLTALGFGMGNYKNNTLEALAKSGDGNHFYIRNLNDSKKVLGNIGNLINIARDVKLNVEFNPNLVANYRLIGYENRLLMTRDFEDDTKDAGELGYGHQVTAVFEIEKGKAETVESQFTKQKNKLSQKELAFVKLRYKPMEDSSSIERRYSLFNNSEVKENNLLNLLIAFGLELRDSEFKGELTPQQIINMAKQFHAKEQEEIELKNSILRYFQ